MEHKTFNRDIYLFLSIWVCVRVQCVRASVYMSTLLKMFSKIDLINAQRTHVVIIRQRSNHFGNRIYGTILNGKWFWMEMRTTEWMSEYVSPSVWNAASISKWFQKENTHHSLIQMSHWVCGRSIFFCSLPSKFRSILNTHRISFSVDLFGHTFRLHLYPGIPLCLFSCFFFFCTHAHFRFTDNQNIYLPIIHRSISKGKKIEEKVANVIKESGRMKKSTASTVVCANTHTSNKYMRGMRVRTNK